MAIFMNLSDIAVNKNAISEKNEAGKWLCVPYETKLGKGNLLTVSQSVMPEDIVFNIDLIGWHRIYLCMTGFLNDTYTYVKLTDDRCFAETRFSPRVSPCKWMPYEYMQEFYWKSADLTNQQLILRKPDMSNMANSDHIVNSNLVWIRCEKMDDSEIKAYNFEPVRCIQGHIDCDFLGQDIFENVKSSPMKVEVLKNSNMEFFSLEMGLERDRIKYDSYIAFNRGYADRWQGENFDVEAVYREYLETAHSHGMKMYAGFRMCPANYSQLIIPKYYNKHFFKEHPELYVKNRDGSTLNVCSYAFEKTREYMIDLILKDTEIGVDGVSLYFVRGGMFMGFEAPVLERFNELYPGVNPVVLPITDERLHGVWCEFMTGFMRELRTRLGKSIKINVVTDYGLTSSKHLGLDVVAWAKEGLIDSASQGDMETFEDLSDCLADDGTVDLEKYKEKTKDTEIIRRNYGIDVDKICSHIAEYTALEKYGVDAYITLPWVSNCDVEKCNGYIEKMKKHGAKKFHAWNTNYMLWNLPGYNTMRFINNDQYRVDDLITHYRTLSIDGQDISGANPNWRG